MTMTYHEILAQVEALNDEERTEPVTLEEFLALVHDWKAFHAQNFTYNPLKWETVFHIYADNADEWTESPREALSDYHTYDERGEPNIRLWIELYTDKDHRDSGDDAAEED